MIKQSQYGVDMKVIKVISYNKVIVQFQDEHKFEKEIFWSNFKRGTVKNPYDKIIMKHGYYGVGKYKARVNNKITKEYNAWSTIITRCYSEKHRYLFKSYIDCEICDEWLNFQTFAKWFEETIMNYQTTKKLKLIKIFYIKEIKYTHQNLA
jgi:hypothetical protein